MDTIKNCTEDTAMLALFKTVTGPCNGSEGKHLYYDTRNSHTKYFTCRIIGKENPLCPVLYAVAREKNI